ncbi:asparagine synthase-related protein [Haematospirillum jordaniae]|uniref:asparagine synthase-related protein n=1 Tax=Haematospirillum jordaniae TaxID=1549855 RepID=UPI0012E72744|nr:asparagine synthase-related protein [Haematospirillum jordaniae]NKD44742.1 hypothetical protein [Haematospirillum jordaniae]NKD89652.1 hypothetical protein [Haematospirillum jordaniae]NKD91799.1 hypothetical protein [Haematospirillum jordaniae]
MLKFTLLALTGHLIDELDAGVERRDHLAPTRKLLSPLKPTRLGWIVAKPGESKVTWYRSLANSEWAHFLSAGAQAGLANVAAEELACWDDLCPSPHFIDESYFVSLRVENLHPVTIAGDLPAMVAPVEFRSPFFDQEMVSFALATPAEKIPSLKNSNGLKAILATGCV